MKTKGIDSVFLSVTALVSAPSIASYVIWILSDAVRRNIKTLFFLARDGLIPCNIAKALCKAWNINIECKYLYCSRVALRLPLYLLVRDYAMDKLCSSTYKVTVADILARANIFGEQSKAIAKEIDINPCEPLKKHQLADIKIKLSASKTFDCLATVNAKAALENTKGYLGQEISSSKSFAIVDTGWEGSIQTCIAYLLEEAIGVPKNSVIGYYLGMFKLGNPQFGEYNCFLFSSAKKLIKFIGFSNNLTECLFAADHGMTLGYEQSEGKWKPILAKSEQALCSSAWDSYKQIELCVAYAESFAKVNSKWQKGDLTRELLTLAKRLLLGLMAKPTLDEARLYGAIPFSDGMTVDVSTSLAVSMSPEQLEYKSLSCRVIDKSKARRREIAPEQPVYWVNGALTLSGCGALKKLDARLLDILYWVLYR